jgi:PAS domain S-box-containing protein
MTALVWIIFFSIAFQLSAAILALRLIRITGRRTGWLLIAVAVSLMTFRRIESLLMLLNGSPYAGGSVLFEIVGLLLSVLMLAGIWRISPIFQELADSREELRAANASLNLLMQEQKQLLDHSTDFIYHHDLRGNITFASPAVERITGFSAQEWRGPFAQYYTDNPVNAVGREVTAEIIRSGKTGPSYRVEVRHKEGGTRWLEVNKQAYQTDGKVAGVIGVARDVTERVRLEGEREGLIVELREALDKIRTLKEMLPICASCKKIRDDQGYWNQIESYIRAHTGTEFTHSICPDCAQRLYPEIYAKIVNGKKS